MALSSQQHGDWSVWDWIIARAPGFPAAGALGLAAPGSAAAVDGLAREVERSADARAAALAALHGCQRSRPVNKAIRAIERGELPGAASDAPPELGEAAPAIDALARALAGEAEARRAAGAMFDDEGRRIAAFLNEIAGEPRFREAMLWQNRVAVHGSVAALLRRPVDAIDSKTREQRRLVASCVQRYCAKNDTIGFFGPVGWARVAGDAPAIAVRPGADLLARRTVYFEYWCIDALAQRLARDPEQRAYLRPVRMPLLRLDGDAVWQPSGARTELPHEFARVLAALDGAATARELAAALGGDEAELFDLIDQLARKGLCSWGFELPTATFRPEDDLRAALERTGGAARARGLDALDRLEAGRAAVAAAAGDPDRLDGALAALEQTFEELTETSATRKGGATYAGRTLIYEDCRRDLDIAIGPAIVERLTPALGLVLDSARWYTHAIAARYEVAFRGVYDALRAEDAGAVDFPRFLERARLLFPGPDADHGIVHEVAAALQAKWEAILGLVERGIDERTEAITRTTGELRAAVAAAFAAPGPGWPSARHHSPDISIAATGVDAILRGDYRIVLGELHVGFNTMTLPCLLKEHADPEVLVRAREADLPEPGIAPVWSRARNRADFFSVSRHDYDLETGATRSARPRDQVLVAAALVVEHAGGRLVVRPRDGGRSFDLTAVMEHHLIAESFSRFRLFAARAHAPRITIDHVVVQRESWRFTSDAVDFVDAASELDRFLAARRFAARHGMPRFCFAKADAEAKPCLVDFASPLLIEILARQIKRSRGVVISEMSPDFDHCWLTDARGERYTSELRLAAVDPIPWQPRPS